MTLVKICGVTNLEDALVAVDAGADALGFNFYARSPRYIQPQTAREIIDRLPEGVLCVGVFVNEADPATVAQLADEAGVTALQLHGAETPDYCLALQDRYVIKALHTGVAFSPEHALEYQAKAILLDAYSPRAYGGTGQTIDWSLARKTRELIPRLFLAGGLSSENVVEAIHAVAPYAVDACSCLEQAPSRKDAARVRAFIAAAHSAC